MEEKKNNAQEQDFQAPETTSNKKEEGKFLGLSKKQWGIGLATVATFAGGFITGHKVGNKQGIKRGYACGRAVGAVINNCSTEEASNVLGTDANKLRAQDQEYLGHLRAQGRIK